ncbi:MAG: hypothetical protein NTY88_13650 [Bacteroidetes bacterium]|nr:hypothetical protein [Bacteroidota bacterium]
MKKTFLKAALMFVATASAFTGFAQTNLGAACGCPPVASRPTVNLSTKATYVGLPNDYELNDCFTVLSCDTTYILDHKIYIPSGKTLIIQPGTLVQGVYQADATLATSLVAEVGGKLIAQGSESCPIVFTSTSDDLTGSYGIQNRGRWGGIVMLGRATNNLTLAKNGPAGAGKLCVSDGVGYLEGYNSSNTRNNHGKLSGSFDDNDNSGVLSYVSIRYAGAVLNASGNELNSLSLGSVGRGTKLNHLEIISGDDDGIELFGGTVDIKYAAILFGNDDMLDWDLGWSGRAQFVLGVAAADTSTSPGNDNGIEADADDNSSCNTPRSHPKIYNATFISNHDVTINGDNSGNYGINAKELTEGEIYSSIFANYKGGFNMTKTVSGARSANCSVEAWHNWSNSGTYSGGSLIFSCNTIVGCNDSILVNKGTAGVVAADRTKFSADGNTAPSSVPGFTSTYAMNGSTNVVTTGFDPTPTPALSSSCTPPSDGFFTSTSYRGAFGDGNNWLAKWSYVSILGAAAGDGFSTSGCPTDINGDGTTNNADFLDLLGKFNQTCQ